MNWSSRVGSSIYLNLGLDSVTVSRTAPSTTGSAVPEPGTWAMMIGGLALVACFMRGKQAKPGFA